MPFGYVMYSMLGFFGSMAVYPPSPPENMCHFVDEV